MDVSHLKSVLLHDHYDAFIFHLLNAIVLEAIRRDFFHLIFISLLAVELPQ